MRFEKQSSVAQAQSAPKMVRHAITELRAHAVELDRLRRALEGRTHGE